MASWLCAIGPAALLAAALALAGIPAVAAPGSACPDSPHRFETFPLAAPALGHAKRILVYLPPGYDCAPRRRYPVLYFNDGHDLFDWSPFAADLDPALAAEIARREGWYGSWRLAAQLDRAQAEGLLPALIVVGIAADDGLRSRDLAPVPWRGSAEGRGRQYARFVARTLVPAIDARYRTLAQRRCRAIAGASLGAVSALQIGLAHPDRFARVLALSPLLGDPALAAHLATTWRLAAPAGPSTFLIDFDDDPLGRADRAWLAAVTAATASPERRITLLQTRNGRHTIASWAERVIPALAHLLATPCSE